MGTHARVWFVTGASSVIDHEASAHFKAGVAQLNGLVAGTPEVTLLLPVGEAARS